MENEIKFSIIVSVYNTEKYVEKCIDSILDQTYTNYEIIIINDGSTDNSKKKLEKYLSNEKIKILTQPNQGLSVARNVGLKESTGDFILFVDSDDYIDENLLENIVPNIDSDIDMVRFQVRTVNESYKTITNYNEEPFYNLRNAEAIEKLVEYHFIENSWAYCYRKDLFINNNLRFDIGFIHEDFGLTPLLISKANKITSIDYIGYNYLCRNNSIMNDQNIDKVIKKCNDFITLGIRNINIIKNDELKNKEILLSYIANSILIKGKDLDKISRKRYYKQIKENNIENYLLTDTLFRKIKKLLFKLNYNLFLRVIS